MSAAYQSVVVIGGGSSISWSDPTPQTQVAAGSASVTFNAPSGGTAPYSYSASLTKPGGSSASLSGSGLGAYTFTTDVTGVYTVALSVTDALGLTSQAIGVVSLVKDYLPPSPPARQDLTAGTTSANVDFGRATGQTTSGTPTAIIDKPSGSSASVSVSDTGSAWRVAVSGMANGEAYRVGLIFTASDGQVCYQTAEVTVAAGAATWATLVDLDLTNCTNQTGLGTDGTRTIVINGVNVTLVTSHTTSTEGTTTASLVNGSGLEVTHTPSATTPPQNRTFGFDLSTLYGSDINPDRNQLCLEVTLAISAMPTNNDQLTWELGEANPISSNNPGYTAKLKRISSSNWTLISGFRQTSSATESAGQTFKTSLPSSWHAQLIGMGWSWEIASEESLSVSNPHTPSLRGNCGMPTNAPADSAPNYWGTSQYAQVTVTGNANAAAVVFVIKRIRLLSKQPQV